MGSVSMFGGAVVGGGCRRVVGLFVFTAGCLEATRSSREGVML